MSGFIRPEVAARLWHWREVLASSVVVLFGLWLGTTPSPVLRIAAAILILCGAILTLIAVRRARFARDGAGPGVVSLDEGRVSYLGPFYGGHVALAELTAISLRTTPGRGRFWVLTHLDGVLVIPINAKGAETLFDAFTTLPDLSMTRILSKLDRKEPGTITLWRRPAKRP